MFSKNQDSCEFWVDLSYRLVASMQKDKTLLVKFFLCYWTIIMDLIKNFEVLIFPFSDILQGKVSTSKILPS